MKKFLCLLICSLWLYSCSDDSNPTGNDFSNMKFQSVSIKVHGMNYTVLSTGSKPKSEIFGFGFSMDEIDLDKLIYINGLFSYDSSYNETAGGGYSSGETILKFKLNKAAKVIDSLWVSYSSSSGYNHVAFLK